MYKFQNTENRKMKFKKRRGKKREKKGIKGKKWGKEKLSWNNVKSVTRARENRKKKGERGEEKSYLGVMLRVARARE